MPSIPSGPTPHNSECAGGAERGYEIRDKRDLKEGRPSIEAWLPGWLWPVVRAVYWEPVTITGVGTWYLLVDREVGELAGLSSVWTAVEAVDADHALEWVNLLTGLYVKAVAK
jgi:hypothetical protein